jgi:hypothetical protein
LEAHPYAEVVAEKSGRKILLFGVKISVLGVKYPVP